jgi:hypothetical protein
VGVEAAFVRAWVLGSGDRSPVPASGRRRETLTTSTAVMGRSRREVAFWCAIDSDSTVILQVLFPDSLIRLALLQGFSMALALTAALSSAALVNEGKGRWPCRSPLVCARVVCQHLCCE